MKKIFIIILAITVLAATVFFYFFKFSKPQNNLTVNKKILQSSVTSITGTAEYFSNNGQQWQNLNIGQILNEGDQIKTGASSSVEVIFYNHARVSLDSNTAVVINSMLAPDETNQNLKINLFLQIGRIWNRIVNLVDSNSTYEVETSEAVAAVRGTVFDMRVNGNGRTEVSVVEHQVQVTAKKTQQTVLVLENQGATVVPSSDTSTIPTIIVSSSTLDLKDAWVIKNLGLDTKFNETVKNELNNKNTPDTIKQPVLNTKNSDLKNSEITSSTQIVEPVATSTKVTSTPPLLKPVTQPSTGSGSSGIQPMPADGVLVPGTTYFETDQTLDDVTTKKISETKLVIRAERTTITLGAPTAVVPVFVNSDGTETKPGQCLWSVIDEQIVTIDNRVVTGQGVGETTIAAKCPHPTLPVNYYAALDIKVIAPTVGANALR